MLLTACLLGALWLVARRLCEGFAYPAWFCGLWGVGASGAAWVDTQPWWHVDDSLLLIVGAGIALLLGAIGGRNLSHRAGAGLRQAQAGQWRGHGGGRAHRFLVVALALVLAFAYISVLALLDDLGTTMAVFFQPDELLAIAAAASIARYHEGFNPAPLTRVLSTAIFLSGLMTGWYVATASARRRWLCVALALTPPLCWTVLLTTKGSVLMWLVLFIAAQVAFRPYAPPSPFGIRRWLFGGGAAAALVVLLVAVQLSRYGAEDLSMFADVVEGLWVSAIGQYFTLRAWFELDAHLLPRTLGQLSLAGLFEAAGLGERVAGLYDQDVDVGGSFTNVYSALRGLVEDFGLPAAALLMAGLGAWGALTQGRPHPVARALHATGLAWILWSPIVSIFNYNSILTACSLLIVLALAIDGTARSTGTLQGWPERPTEPGAHHTSDNLRTQGHQGLPQEHPP